MKLEQEFHSGTKTCTLSCKQRTTTCFSVKSASQWMEIGSAKSCVVFLFGKIVGALNREACLFCNKCLLLFANFHCGLTRVSFL